MIPSHCGHGIASTAVPIASCVHTDSRRKEQVVFKSESVFIDYNSMIDDIDYTILKCLDDAVEAFWKKRIYQEIEERREVLPMAGDVSLQTIGRRVDRLHEDGYLENEIVSPQEVPRDLIIGFTVTADGRKLVERKRETLLRELVRKELFIDEPDGDSDIGQKALAELTNNEFGLEGRTVETADRYSREELLILLGTYFLEKQASQVFDEEDVQRFRDVILNQKSPSVVL